MENYRGKIVQPLVKNIYKYSNTFSKVCLLLIEKKNLDIYCIYLPTRCKVSPLPSSSFQMRFEMQKVAASCSFTLECPCRDGPSQATSKNISWKHWCNFCVPCSIWLSEACHHWTRWGPWLCCHQQCWPGYIASDQRKDSVLTKMVSTSK